MAEPTCAHHWDIEPANGPTSRGICRNCHAEKMFSNSTTAVADVIQMSHDGVTLGKMQDHDAKSRIDEIAAVRQIWMN